jgi:hypothetical protein
VEDPGTIGVAEKESQHTAHKSGSDLMVATESSSARWFMPKEEDLSRQGGRDASRTPDGAKSAVAPPSRTPTGTRGFRAKVKLFSTAPAVACRKGREKR